MAVVNGGVVCLAETVFGMAPVVLKRHHYNGPGGPATKSSGTMNLSVDGSEWCSVLGLSCTGGTGTACFSAHHLECVTSRESVFLWP